MIRIGRHWYGRETPPELPPALADFVRRIDDQNDEDNYGDWTLTYAEGYPVVYHSSGVEATIDNDGELVVYSD